MGNTHGFVIPSPEWQDTIRATETNLRLTSKGETGNLRAEQGQIGEEDAGGSLASTLG